MATNASGGKIPEYTAAEAASWFSGIAEYFNAGIEILLLGCAAAGLVLTITGLWQIAQENRDAAYGGGGGRRHGIWMVVAGSGLGSLGVIFLYLVGFFRPALA